MYQLKKNLLRTINDKNHEIRLSETILFFIRELDEFALFMAEKYSMCVDTTFP